MSNVYEALRRAGYPFGCDEPSAPRETVRTEPSIDRLKPSPTTRLEHFREAIATLHGAIRPILNGGSGHILHIVAASDREGTSTIARELALTLSTSGSRRTLLIDANHHNFETARWSGCQRNRGLIDCAQRQLDYTETLQFVSNTPLSVGCLVGETGIAAMEANTLRGLYERLRDRFDVTLMDCPSVNKGSYLELLPEAVDGIILVIRAEKANRAAVARAKDAVQRAGGNIIGAVLNMHNNYVPSLLDGAL
jgi:Mrp family chromosome partitioning ATPase